MSTADGLVLVDKQAGWTSHDVVARVRRLAGTRRVGHAGTLDPMATGVLVLGVGRATKLLTYLVGADKAYAATVRLGQATVTDDAEGEVTQSADPAAGAALGPADVDAALAPLRGAVRQVPSAVSAVKVDGRRSYARVRAGEDVVLAARPVVVHRLERVGPPRPGVGVLDVDVECEVSSGTYVRALARDLGAALGVGAHLTALRRTRVGPYGLDRCATLAQLESSVAVLPLAAAARAAFPARELTVEESRALRFGQRVPASRLPAPTAAFAPDGTLVALLEDRGAEARSLLVVPAD